MIKKVLVDTNCSVSIASTIVLHQSTEIIKLLNQCCLDQLLNQCHSYDIG